MLYLIYNLDRSARSPYPWDPRRKVLSGTSNHASIPAGPGGTRRGRQKRVNSNRGNGDALFALLLYHCCEFALDVALRLRGLDAKWRGG